MTQEKGNTEFPRHVGSHTGTEYGYSVEARYNYIEPKDFGGGLILDQRWKMVNFEPSTIGVPVSGYNAELLRHVGLLNYQAAQALRWWFHAECAKHFSGWGVETRIVKHEIEYSTKKTAVSAHDFIGGDSHGAISPNEGKGQ